MSNEQKAAQPPAEGLPDAAQSSLQPPVTTGIREALQELEAACNATEKHGGEDILIDYIRPRLAIIRAALSSLGAAPRARTGREWVIGRDSGEGGRLISGAPFEAGERVRVVEAGALPATQGVDPHWLMTQCNSALIAAGRDGAVKWRDGLHVIVTKAAEVAAQVEGKEEGPVGGGQEGPSYEGVPVAPAGLPVPSAQEDKIASAVGKLERVITRLGELYETAPETEPLESGLIWCKNRVLSARRDLRESVSAQPTGEASEPEQSPVTPSLPTVEATPGAVEALARIIAPWFGFDPDREWKRCIGNSTEILSAFPATAPEALQQAATWAAQVLGDLGSLTARAVPHDGNRWLVHHKGLKRAADAGEKLREALAKAPVSREPAPVEGEGVELEGDGPSPSARDASRPEEGK